MPYREKRGRGEEANELLSVAVHRFSGTRTREWCMSPHASSSARVYTWPSSLAAMRAGRRCGAMWWVNVSKEVPRTQAHNDYAALSRCCCGWAYRVAEGSCHHQLIAAGLIEGVLLIPAPLDEDLHLSQAPSCRWRAARGEAFH